MKAITVKRIPATNTKPTRMKASAEGVPSIVRSFTGDWGRDEQEAAKLAQELCEKYDWQWPMAAGQLPNGDYVFCFVYEGYNVYTMGAATATA